MIVVHVAGPVRRPGVVILPVGSRVIDALDAAGGIRKGADVGSTNLAALLSDGQRVEVGAPLSAVASPGDATASTTAGPVGMVNLNSATASELDALPGVGPVTAAKILDWRAANGRFNSIDELAEVPGIGPVKLAELRPHVSL
jgi:competence protein ComEA